MSRKLAYRTTHLHLRDDPYPGFVAALYATAGAIFFFELRRFSTGGCRSLFFKLGRTIERTNFFSPWSSNLITICSSVHESTLPSPNLGCSTCALGEKGGLFAIEVG